MSKTDPKTKFWFFCPRNFRKIANLNSKIWPQNFPKFEVFGFFKNLVWDQPINVQLESGPRSFVLSVRTPCPRDEFSVRVRSTFSYFLLTSVRSGPHLNFRQNVRPLIPGRDWYAEKNFLNFPGISNFSKTIKFSEK